MFVKPLVFNSLDTVCTQRVFAEIAQSKASSIILFFVLCDNRKKYFTIWDQLKEISLLRSCSQDYWSSLVYLKNI